MEGVWTATERLQVERMTRVSAVGSPEVVSQRLSQIAEDTEADELMLATQGYDHDSRLRSFEIAVSCFGTGPSDVPGTAT